jgi:hypothetical protein
MTSISHVPDWKVTPGRRILVLVGWGLAALAAYFGVLAVLFATPELWVPAALIALVAMGVGGALPEPVPHDMFTQSRTRVVTERRYASGTGHRVPAAGLEASAGREPVEVREEWSFDLGGLEEVGAPALATSNT